MVVRVIIRFATLSKLLVSYYFEINNSLLELGNIYYKLITVKGNRLFAWYVAFRPLIIDSTRDKRSSKA